MTSKASHKSYRPLTTLSFTIQRQLDGHLSARSMKTVNLVIHIVNCCLMFHFFQSTISDKKAHFLTILMFSVHPIHVEAVCGIVSRSDLMACLMFLLSGIFYFNVFYKGEQNDIYEVFNQIRMLSDSNSFKLNQILKLFVVGVLTSIGVLFKENAIMIMVKLRKIHDEHCVIN